jgi:hypothetical protein
MTKIHLDMGRAWNGRKALIYIGDMMRDRRTGELIPRLRHIEDYLKRSEAIKWERDDQAWAVGEGFFVERSRWMNRPVLTETSHLPRLKHHPRWHRIAYMDGDIAMTTVEHHACLEPESQWEKLLKFIEQQDKFGYRGAWDLQVEMFTKQLHWYKHWLLDRDTRSEFDRERRRAVNAQGSAKSKKPKKKLIVVGPSAIAMKMFEWYRKEKDREAEIAAWNKSDTEHEFQRKRLEAAENAVTIFVEKTKSRVLETSALKDDDPKKYRKSPADRALDKLCAKISRDRIARRGY